MKHFRLFVFVLIFSEFIYSQSTDLKFNHIGLEQGLTQSGVYAIVQDAQGFMWFGTQAGLNRYDGYTIKTFKHNPLDSSSISVNYISNLLCDSDGNLWIGTDHSGVDLYITSENRFIHFVHLNDNPASLSDNRVTKIFEDSNKNIWIATYRGLDKYDNQKRSFIHYSFKLSGPFELNPVYSPVNCVCEDKSGTFWVGTSNGIFCISNLKSGSTENYFSQPSYLNGKNISSILIDKEENIWIGTLTEGLEKFSDNTKTFEKFSQCGNAIQTIYEDKNRNLWLGSAYSSGLIIFNRETENAFQVPNIPNDIINTIYEGNTGIVWIGTYFHGAYSFDKENNRFNHYLNDPQTPNVVMALLEDKTGNVWAGTFGNGLKHFNKQRNKIITYNYNSKNAEGISSNRIISLCESNNGNLWIGTYGGGLDYLDISSQKFKHFTETDGLTSSDITALFEDDKKNLWMGNLIGGVDRLNYAGKFSHYKRNDTNQDSLKGTVTCINQDKEGNIWVGTLNGLYRFIPSLNTFKHYLFSKSGGKELLPENTRRIQTLYIDGNIIWAGTDEGGLIRFDYESDFSTQYTTDNGLSNNVVYGILPDDSQNLWISTNNGISQFNIRSEQFRNFNINDGLQSNEFNQGAYCRASNGELFFGGVNGFNAFFPSNIEINKNIPPVYITTFKVFDKVYPLPNPVTSRSKISFSYNQNFFSFEFVALNYTSPEKNKYAYRLEGFDNDWHYVSASQRYASYTNLDPGTYVLRVKGSNNDEVWNETGTSLILVVTPPFWMTWWFRILSLVLIAGIIIAIYKYRVSQIVRMERMRLRIATDLHDELGSDLSAIALASQMTAGKENTDQQRLHKIRENSLRLIESMREIVWFIKPEHDEPEKFINKIKETTTDLLDGIEYSINVKNDALINLADPGSRQNFFLIYKECLTNIIRHSKCTFVKIEIGNSDLHYNEPLLRISDNGTGFNIESIHSGSGLNNLKIRASRLHSVINIKSVPGEGTVVELSKKYEVNSK